MDIKVNQAAPVTQVQQSEANQASDGTFKFILASNIAEEELQVRLSSMMEEITRQGDKLSKKMDVRDMKRYRGLIKDFMNEVVNFLDKKGRHRVYGIIRQVDDTLDELAKELMKDEKDHLSILGKIGEIRGLLLDIFT